MVPRAARGVKQSQTSTAQQVELCGRCGDQAVARPALSAKSEVARHRQTMNRPIVDFGEQHSYHSHGFKPFRVPLAAHQMPGFCLNSDV
jgi:hypothetical protein